MIVTKQQLGARIMAASDPERFNLSHLKIDENGTVSATNGHLGVIVKAKDLPSEGDIPAVPHQRGGEPHETVYLHAAAAADAIKVLPKDPERPSFQLGRLLLAKGSDGARDTITIGASDTLTHQLVMTEQPEALTFPNLRSVFPAGEPQTVILLNAGYMEMVGKYAKQFGGKGTGVKLSFYGSDQPVLFECGDDRHEVRGLLMPMRMDPDKGRARPDTMPGAEKPMPPAPEPVAEVSSAPPADEPPKPKKGRKTAVPA